MGARKFNKDTSKGNTLNRLIARETRRAERAQRILRALQITRIQILAEQQRRARRAALHDLDMTHPEIIELFKEWRTANIATYGAAFCKKLFEFLLNHHSSEIAVMNEDTATDTNIGEVFIEMIKDDTDYRPLHPLTRQYTNSMDFFIYMVNTY